MKGIIAAAVALLALFGTAWAERADESVLLVQVAFSHGHWQAKAASVLPCEGPSKPDSISATRSMYQLKDRDGRVLLQRYIENPRIILVEDPREMAPMREEISFTLRIPLPQQGKRAISLKDIFTFEFFENSRSQKDPSVTLRLDKDMQALQPLGKLPPCATIVKPPSDKLPPLTVRPGDAVSTESLASLIRLDRGVLIRWGLENGLTPEELTRIVAEHEAELAQVNLDKATVARLLREYEAAYNARKTGLHK